MLKNRWASLAFGPLLLLAAIIVAPFVLPTFWIFVLTLVLVFGIAAIGFNILVGNAGQVSLAHPAFIGIGAYAAALGARYGWPPIVSAMAGLLISTAVATITGLVALRLAHFYLALVTLGVVVVLQQSVTAFGAFTGGAGGVKAPTTVLMSTGFGQVVDNYYTVAVVCLILGWAAHNLLRSYVGRAFLTMKFADVAAVSNGVNLIRYRLLAFVLSAAYAAIAGWLYSGIIGYITPDQFGLGLTVSMLGMVIVGGEGSIAGSLIGSLIFTVLPQVLQMAVQVSVVAFGTAIMAAMLFLPKGVVSLWTRAFQSIAYRYERGRVKGRVTTTATTQSSTEIWSGISAPVVTLAPQDANGSRPSFVLEADRISIAFGGLKALSSVSLAVAPSEILGLIGPNGSGKTTLLNCLSRLYEPSAGQVFLAGRNVTHRPPNALAQMGLRRTFQTPQLVADLPIISNVLLGAHYLTTKSGVAAASLGLPNVVRLDTRLRAEAMAALEFMGIAELANDLVSSVAGPLRKLVEVARAMMASPVVLLLDEIASGLNTAEKQGLAERIATLRRSRGLAIVLVEHDLDFVTGLADRLVVLDAGIVIAEGAPKGVLSASHVVEAYLGTPA